MRPIQPRLRLNPVPKFAFAVLALALAGGGLFAYANRSVGSTALAAVISNLIQQECADLSYCPPPM